jgi:soluble lytic murein transglycosylase-like protein
MSAASVFKGLSARLRWPALALALALPHLPAQADLWAYVDAQGITHFAATQVDERYTLYYKGADVARLNLAGDAAALAPVAKDERLGLKVSGKSGEPAFVVPKQFANIDRSKGYQAVQKHMRAAAKTHQVDYELLKAVIAAESGFNPEAVSPKGAVGLMQLMPPTAEQYGVVADKEGRKDRKGNPLPVRTVEEKLTDPQTNIHAGARYLAYLIKLFKGELELAVAAYNAGEGAVQRAGNKIPRYKETQGYVKTVMGLYSVFKPEQAVVADARAMAAQPIAKAVSRVGGRVRVELPSAGKTLEAAAPSSASPVADAAAGVLTPVLFTVPRLGADVRIDGTASGG